MSVAETERTIDYHGIQHHLDEILAVLVLYRRDLTTTETYRSLARGLRHRGLRLDLLVHDNGPDAARPMPRDETEPFCLRYLHAPENPGVSAACNAGYAVARELGKSRLLLLDQDTVFPDDALERYCRALATHPRIPVFAPVLMAGGRMISPCRYLAGTGFALSGMNPGPQKLKGRGILTSGMLVSLDAFEEAGGFNASVRLDFADFEFNRRLCRTVEQFVLLDLTCRHHFFDTENQDVEQAIQRFRFYCQGARASLATRGEALPRFLVVLAHCLRLSLRFRSVRFLRDFGGYFIRGAEV